MVKIFFLITITIATVLVSSNANVRVKNLRYDGIINLSNYDYPTKETNDMIYTIAILGTNDIHGAGLPMEVLNPVTNTTYNYGGFSYLASHINNLRNHWGDRFLWLDGGDQFQGTIENNISNGTVITDFLNYAKLSGSTIGNHEFDFGRQFLDKRLNSSNWNYITANIYNNITEKPEAFPNTVLTKVFNVGKIKVGVIGLTTTNTVYTTKGDIKNLVFKDYRDIVINESKRLRESGCNAVLLTTHVGIYCEDNVEKYILKVRNQNSPDNTCNNPKKEEELYVLLNELPNGVVDGVVAGHIHQINHYWINNVPVIQNIDGGKYYNIMYLRFNKEGKLVNNLTEIEGPVPVCEKIFLENLNCRAYDETEHSYNKMYQYVFHGNLIKEDPEIKNIFNKYKDQIAVYKEKLAFTTVKLFKNYDSENQLGNIITDIMRDETNSDVSIFNTGALRTTWNIGYITYELVFNMFPFLDNKIVTFDMTGAELKKCMEILQQGQMGFYQTSGLYQKVQVNPKKLLEPVKLYKNREVIDDNKTYKITSINFLLDGGDDFHKVLEFYKPRNVVIVEKVMRDIIAKYIKEKKVITDKDNIDPSNPRLDFN